MSLQEQKAALKNCERDLAKELNHPYDENSLAAIQQQLEGVQEAYKSLAILETLHEILQTILDEKDVDS